MSASDAVAFWDSHFDHSEVARGSSHDLPEQLRRATTFFGPVHGKRVLDIGCGMGENAVALAHLGAFVTAIDTSSVAIQKLNSFAQSNGLPIVGLVHDAMRIDELGRFDFVIGAMILHHLEPFAGFCDALHATLLPGGHAFFYENNAASRLLVWARQNLTGRFGIPKYGDDEEFPLTPQEVDMLRRRFTVRQEFPEMVFFGMAAIYLLRRHGEAICRKLDSFFLQHNILTSYSYRQVLLIERGL